MAIFRTISYFSRYLLIHLFFLTIFIKNALSGLAVELEDSVNGGAFLYYNLTAPEAVYLQLTSKKGDCDLYVSEDEVFPTFQDYSLHSATCGVDAIFISTRYKRPIYIGVYGHPSYDYNECLMTVCLIEESEDLKRDKDVSELMDLSEKLIKENCSRGDVHLESFISRGLRILVDVATAIQFDGILFELATAFAQAII